MKMYEMEDKFSTFSLPRDRSAHVGSKELNKLKEYLTPNQSLRDCFIQKDAMIVTNKCNATRIMCSRGKPDRVILRAVSGY